MVPYKLLKKCPSLLWVLWRLHLLAWKTMVVHQSWCVADGVHIPKEAEYSALSQLRQIYLLNVEGEIFFAESAGRMTQFALENGYINTSVQKAGIPGSTGCLQHDLECNSGGQKWDGSTRSMAGSRQRIWIGIRQDDTESHGFFPNTTGKIVEYVNIQSGLNHNTRRQTRKRSADHGSLLMWKRIRNRKRDEDPQKQEGGHRSCGAMRPALGSA